jgi:hypothetical protein
MAFKNVWAGNAKPEIFFKVNKKGEIYYHYLKDHRVKHFIFQRAIAMQEAMRHDKKKVVESLKVDPTASCASSER